jgi:hypothetical protein
MMNRSSHLKNKIKAPGFRMFNKGEEGEEGISYLNEFSPPSLSGFFPSFFLQQVFSP